MRRGDQGSPERVGLWRHTSALLVASLFSLLLSQPFHEREASAAGAGAPAVVAGAHDAAGRSPLQGAGHDRDHCVQCRAVAQTRTGLRAPAYEGAPRVHGPALALHVETPDRLVSGPEPCVAGPRAPPSLLLILNS